MGVMMHEQDDRGEVIVQVPVPTRLLSAVYRVLAEGMAPAPPSAVAGPADRFPAAAATGQSMIDLIIAVACQLQADRHPVRLGRLHAAYLQAYPDVGKGQTSGSFDATLYYHTINMPARFLDPADPRQSASWLTRPTFKRMSRGHYMLLSDAEIAWFRQAVADGHPLVYQDEYDVADLAPGTHATVEQV